MAPRLKRERGCGCRNLAKSFIAFFGFIAIFVFHRVFSNQDGPSRFFSCTRVSQVYIYICVCIIHHGCINWPCHVSQGARSLRDSIEEVHGLGTSDALLEAASGACVIILRMAVSWQLPDLCKTYMFQDGWMTHTYNNIYIYIYYIMFFVYIDAYCQYLFTFISHYIHTDSK